MTARLFLLAWTLMASLPAAAEPKTVRITGLVSDVRDDMVVIDKGKDRWEVARTPGTAVKGNLQKGARISIEVRMSAAAIEVLPDRKKAP